MLQYKQTTENANKEVIFKNFARNKKTCGVRRQGAEAPREILRGRLSSNGAEDLEEEELLYFKILSIINREQHEFCRTKLTKAFPLLKNIMTNTG